MATTVSRRLVYVKRTRNPHAPLPRRTHPVVETIGDRTKRPLATPARTVPAARSRKLALSGAILVVAVCIGAGIAALQDAMPQKRHAEETAAVLQQHTARRVQEPVSEHDLQGEVLPSVLAQRAAPTDEGFRASGYVRRR